MKALSALSVVGTEKLVLIVIAVVAVYALTPNDLKTSLLGFASAHI